MPEREVTHSKLDNNGVVLALCNPAAKWEKIYKDNAIKHIEFNRCRYYIINPFGIKEYVKVEMKKTQKLLIIDGNRQNTNILMELPEYKY